MIQVKEIVIKRIEGCTLHGRVDEEITVSNWNEAEEKLLILSATAPKEGYDKTKFKIIFEDGMEYNGRYDLKHTEIELPSLYNHVKDFILFHAGLNKPYWMDENRYIEVLTGIDTSVYEAFAMKYLGLVKEME